MSKVAVRELRNNTVCVIERVQRGEEVTITVRGRPVAALVPLEGRRRRPLPKAELIRRLKRSQADPGVGDDLARLAGGRTDDLDQVP